MIEKFQYTPANWRLREFSSIFSPFLFTLYGTLCRLRNILRIFEYIPFIFLHVYTSISDGKSHFTGALPLIVKAAMGGGVPKILKTGKQPRPKPP
jgi:hypothetical protein